MGNKSTTQAQIQDFQNNYVKHGEEDNKNYGHVSYYHNKYAPSEMVMLKSQWSNSLAESEDMDAIIANRQNINHPNIAKTTSYIKQDVAGIYLVLKAEDAQAADTKLATLPYYPYMKIAIVALR